MKRLFFLLTLFTIFNCANEALEPEQRACVETTAALAKATTNFNTVTPENYLELCNAYRIALQNQKEFCGDGDGNIQGLLDGLGDCEGTPPPSDCSSASASSAIASTNYDNANDSNYTDLCIAYKVALENQKTICGDVSGDIELKINALGDCTTQPVSNGALMTANLIDEQFDFLVPFLYPFTNKATSVVTFAADGDVEKYLKLQGNNNPNELTDFSKEINLYIPESLWKIGTYNLHDNALDSSSNPSTHFNIIYNDGTEYTQAFEESGGTLTITEMDLISRNIKGTFEFTFTRSSSTDAPDTGPFNCLNGTFDYDLDDDYFD